MGVSIASPRRLELAGLLLVVAASILVRAPFFSVPMISDEGGYAYVATFWSSTYQLYRDIPFDRPQAIFPLYALAIRLFGPGVEGIRLFAAVYNGVSVAAIFFLCRRVLSTREAWVAAALFSIFSASPRIEGFTGNAETFLLLPLIVAAHLTWRQQWFWAGVAGAVAVLLKPTGLSAWLLTASWILVTRAAPGAWLRLAAGAGLGVLPSVAHGMWVGWEYYWQSIHERRLVLYTPETLGWSAQAVAIKRVLALTVSSWAFLAIASVLATMRARTRPVVFGILWVAFSALGVAMGGWWREHYFIQLVPSLAFLASVGLTRLRTSPLRAAWTIALILAAVVFVRRDAALAFRTPDAISWELYQRPGYLMAKPIADYIRTQTTDDDTIYVAFAEAEIYYLAGRRAAVPQFYYLHAQYSQRVFDSVTDAIKAGRPAIVVLVNQPPSNMMSPEEFLEILSREYAPGRVFTIPGHPSVIRLFHRIRR
jgi:hypothetical protein